MFKASQGATEGTGLSFLDVPYLGPCKMINAELKEINDTPNCFTVEFGELTGEDYTGNPVNPSSTHEHTEWAPSAQNTEEQKQNKADRIAYIVGRVVPKEKVLGVTADNWVDYCNAMINLLNQHNYKQKQLYMKAMGNVYEGKPRVKFPGYRSFLSAEEGELSWSAKEKASNDEYLEALKSPASAATSNGVAEPVEEAGF